MLKTSFLKSVLKEELANNYKNIGMLETIKR